MPLCSVCGILKKFLKQMQHAAESIVFDPERSKYKPSA